MYSGLISLRKRRSPRGALHLTRDIWKESQRVSGGNAKLQAAYGPVWMDMWLRLGDYLQERGTLGFPEEQQALPFPPFANPCVLSAREILGEATGARSPEDLRHCIFVHLERRRVSEDRMARLLPVNVGDEASYGDIAGELWDMWHRPSSREAGD